MRNRIICNLCETKDDHYKTKLVKKMKINLKVTADFDLDGKIIPKVIEWEDGRIFAIDRVLDMRRAASLKAGGVGMRYICRICGKTVALFNDENKWFMEGKEN